MDIHKVKPVHGWREFFGEVGIIVLGVMIALAAEAVVERLHWRREVAEARETFGRDIAEVYEQATERELIAPCLARRLGQVAAILDEAARTRRLPPIGASGAPASRPYWMSSWEALTASGVISHLPRAELLGIGGVANEARYLAAYNEAEMRAWTQLDTIVGPGRPLGDAEEASLRRALAEASYNAKLMRIVAMQMRQQIRKGRLNMDPDTLAQAVATMEGERRGLATKSTCRPIGPPPPHYGESPFNADLLSAPSAAFRRMVS